EPAADVRRAEGGRRRVRDEADHPRGHRGQARPHGARAAGAMSTIRVLVVDDAVVMRRLVGDVLAAEPDIEVVTAANGRIGLSKLVQTSPDAVVLDIEMPELDGLGALRELRRTHPRLPVVMFSTLTERGAAATLEAMSLGAS